MNDEGRIPSSPSSITIHIHIRLSSLGFIVSLYSFNVILTRIKEKHLQMSIKTTEREKVRKKFQV